MRVKKVVIYTAAGIILTALIVIFAVARYFASQKISYDEHFSAGVVRSVTIERDSSGIPLIRASEAADAWYGLGYTHAFDRLPVMEYDRLVASGKAENIFRDEQGKLLSRLVVMLDIQAKAALIYSELDEKHRRLLDSYTAGINDCKRRHSVAIYADSAFDSSPWKSEDLLSIAILRDWAYSLSAAKELQFAIPEKKYFPGLEDFFQPGVICRYKDRYAASADFIFSVQKAVERYTGGRGSSISFYTPNKDSEDECFIYYKRKYSSIYPDAETVLFEIGGLKMTCSTRAGSPFPESVIADKIRYSVSPADIDVTDFYLLPVETRDGVKKYYSDLTWKSFSESKITMKSGEFVFRKTDFGPVLSDIKNDGDDSACIAVRSAVYTAKTVETLLDMPFSLSFDESIRLASQHNGMPMIFLVNEAARSAVIPAGLLPMRPVKGVFFQEHNYTPQNLDLSTLKKYFNGQKAVAGSDLQAYSYTQIAEYLPYSFDPFIDEIRASVLGDFSRTAAIKLLSSSASSFDYALSRSFIKLLDTVPVTSAKLSKLYLGEWDSSLSSESRAPVIYHQLFNQILFETFDDELGNDVRQIQEKPWLINSKFSAMIGKAESKAFDNVTTPDDFETFDKIFGNSFIKAMRILHRVYGPEMDAWHWSNVHTAQFAVPFMRSDTINRYLNEDEKNALNSSAMVVPAAGDPGRFDVKDYASSALMNGSGITEIRNYGISIHPRSEYSKKSPSDFTVINMNDYSRKYAAVIEPVLQPAVVSQ